MNHTLETLETKRQACLSLSNSDILEGLCMGPNLTALLVAKNY